MNAVGGLFDETALMWGAENGHEAVVRVLLENGAEVNVADKHGHTALMKAAENEHEAVVRVLLENGADKHGCTALAYANTQEIRGLLSKAGAFCGKVH